MPLTPTHQDRRKQDLLRQKANCRPTYAGGREFEPRRSGKNKRV